jgi:hypothetical protein
MHAGIAIEDAVNSAASGRVGEAVGFVLRRSVARSVAALLEQTRQISRLAQRRKHLKPQAVRQPTGQEEKYQQPAVSNL